MIHHFDYRWATYEPDGSTRLVTSDEKADPSFVVMPRYWVAEELVDERLDGRSEGDWLLGWRDICRSTDERTMIASTFPRVAVNHKLPIAITEHQASLCAVWTSFAFDYIARQKIGGTSMTYFYLKQFPAPTPSTIAEESKTSQVISRNVPLLTIGHTWNPEERSRLRAELDAAFFHLYGIERDDVDHIMDTFPIVKRKDEAKYGEYRTKRMILEIYDAMDRELTPINRPKTSQEKAWDASRKVTP